MGKDPSLEVSSKTTIVAMIVPVCSELKERSPVNVRIVYLIDCKWDLENWGI